MNVRRYRRLIFVRTIDESDEAIQQPGVTSDRDGSCHRSIVAIVLGIKARLASKFVLTDFLRES